MVRLHLGCGDVRFPNPTWVNIDRRELAGEYLQADIAELPQFEPGTVDEIYSCHVLDHFSRFENEYEKVLGRWFALLKPGGLIRISLPDFAATVEQYQRAGLAELQGQLCAQQNYRDNVRHFHWDFKQATADLEAIGFETPKRYDAGKWLAQWGVTDCSVYVWTIKHQWDERAIELPRSLNITARKP